MMKKIFLFLCIFTFTAFSINAQLKKGSRDKIKALKVAYLTEQLELTTSEAEKFWPIYNIYDKEQNKLRSKNRAEIKRAIKKNGDIESITEKEAERLIDLKLENDKKIYESKKVFIAKVKNILPAKKILKLQVAEIDFARKLMRKYKRKRLNKDE